MIPYASPKNTEENVDFESRAVNGAADLPELREIEAAWPSLPEAIKTGILAMVRTSVK